MSGILKRFLENLIDSEFFFCIATARMKTIQLWFNYFAAPSSKALGMHYPERLRIEMSL